MVTKTIQSSEDLLKLSTEEMLQEETNRFIGQIERSTKCRMKRRESQKTGQREETLTGPRNFQPAKDFQECIVLIANVEIIADCKTVTGQVT